VGRADHARANSLSVRSRSEESCPFHLLAIRIKDRVAVGPPVTTPIRSASLWCALGPASVTFYPVSVMLAHSRGPRLVVCVSRYEAAGFLQLARVPPHNLRLKLLRTAATSPGATSMSPRLMSNSSSSTTVTDIGACADSSRLRTSRDRLHPGSYGRLVTRQSPGPECTAFPPHLSREPAKVEVSAGIRRTDRKPHRRFSVPASRHRFAETPIGSGRCTWRVWSPASPRFSPSSRDGEKLIRNPSRFRREFEKILAYAGEHGFVVPTMSILFTARQHRGSQHQEMYACPPCLRRTPSGSARPISTMASSAVEGAGRMLLRVLLVLAFRHDTCASALGVRYERLW